MTNLKGDGIVKGRAYDNGRMQHSCAPKDEANTLKATTRSMLLTADVEAKGERDIVTLEMPSVFLQKNYLKMNLK